MTKPAPPRFPLPLDRVGRAGSGPGAQATLRPQRPVHEAHRDAHRQATPSGLGLDSAPVRRRMVERLRAEGIRSAPLLEAMALVPRHEFVDTALATQAYEDTSLPIGLGQTISKPSVVARMIDLLCDTPGFRERGDLGRVLEIGTGSGYLTALLAQLARRVVSIERLAPLHAKAVANLAPWRRGRVQLVHGDGMVGHRSEAPYDAIIAAAGGDALPEAWVEQLAVGGRLVAPTRRAGERGQVLAVVDRHDKGSARAEYEAVHFVPLKSGIA